MMKYKVVLQSDPNRGYTCYRGWSAMTSNRREAEKTLEHAIRVFHHAKIVVASDQEAVEFGWT